MSKMLNIAIPVTLLLSALVLSACASKPEAVSVAEPAPVAAEKPPAPEAMPEATAAPVAIAEQPAVRAKPVPKPVIRKTKKIAARHTPPKTPPPPPVMTPAPVVEQQAQPALPPEPNPPIIAPLPVQKIAEPSFLERYWLWLLGFALIAVVFASFWRIQEAKH
jgi:hypothetical protein